MRTRFYTMLVVLFAAFQASAMSVEQSRNEAWFLTDKMAHELRLSNYQWDDVYEVNYDYFRALGHVTANYSSNIRMREQKLMYILTVAQWNEYCRLSYFTTPCVAVNGNWSFTIYTRYSRDRFFDRNHNVVFTYNGNRTGWDNYYRDRHITSGSYWSHNNGNSNWNHNNGNSNWNHNNGNHYGNTNNNYNNNGNHNGHSNQNWNSNGNNGNRTGGTLASRTPSSRMDQSNSNGSNGTHVTQNTGTRRH